MAKPPPTNTLKPTSLPFSAIATKFKSLAEVGLVGKGPGKYNLHLGGDRQGTRIPRIYRENIDEIEIMSELDSLIGRWSKERDAGEAFGDFLIRAEVVKPVIDSAKDFYDDPSYSI